MDYVNMAQRAGMGGPVPDFLPVPQRNNNPWPGIFHDWGQGIIDVVGAARSDSPYISPRDPRYREGAEPYDRRAGVNVTADVDRSGNPRGSLSISQDTLKIAGMVGLALLAGVLLSGGGKRKRG